MGDARREEILHVGSMVFCAVFAVEIALRLAIQRTHFFRGEERCWNIFDLVVVLLQVTDELVSEAELRFRDHQVRRSFSFAEVFRVLRIVRILRIVRMVHLVRDLRTMVRSIGKTFLSLFWTMVLLFLLMYAFGICFMQVVADSAGSDPQSIADGTPAHEYFGTVERSMLVLFQSIIGGVNWKDPLAPLVDVVSPAMVVPFALYIVLAVFAFLNIITGVCVDTSIAKAQEETTEALAQSLREAVLSMTDEEECGRLTWVKFKDQIGTPQMQSYLRSIDLHPSEAEGLFRLLDPDETGSIDAEEFVMGCLRLHGTAKAIDLTTLMCEVRWLRRKWDGHAQMVEMVLLDHASHAGSLGSASEGPSQAGRDRSISGPSEALPLWHGLGGGECKAEV